MGLEKYGFIGLGDQGAPIVRRMIDAGLPVVLWARRAETLTPFADTAAQLVTDIADFAALVDYVGICVLDDNGVREVCGQLIPRLRPASTIVVHSTVSPELCKVLAVQAQANHLTLIDAPVSGGSPAAKEGKLTVMVGGDEAVLEGIRPVFGTFAHLIVHLGAVGAGQYGKLINNAMLAANIGIAHHALEAAEALFLDRQAFVDLINASSGRSFGFEVRGRLPNPTLFQHGANLLAKDMALLGDALGDHGSFSPMRDAAQGFLSQALQGGGDQPGK
jgi:3-hydroxyisobutyrate dehydrogenase-like beta-hydroxyacid dehydrogenase